MAALLRLIFLDFHHFLFFSWITCNCKFMSMPFNIEASPLILASWGVRRGTAQSYPMNIATVVSGSGSALGPRRTAYRLYMLVVWTVPSEFIPRAQISRISGLCQHSLCCLPNQLKHKHGAVGNVCYEGLVSAGIYWVFSEVVGGDVTSEWRAEFEIFNGTVLRRLQTNLLIRKEVYRILRKLWIGNSGGRRSSSRHK